MVKAFTGQHPPPPSRKKSLNVDVLHTTIFSSNVLLIRVLLVRTQDENQQLSVDCFCFLFFYGHGRRRVRLPPCKFAPRPAFYSLGSEAHAEAGQVAVGEGEEDHEDHVPGVVREEHGQVVAGLHVTQHEERHKHQPCRHQSGEPTAVLARLTPHPPRTKENTRAHPNYFRHFERNSILD